MARRTHPMNRPRGFTLIELMIVVAMVGVLSSLAGVSYGFYTARAKRTEAYTLLSGVNTAQEAHWASNGKFAGTFDELGFELLSGRRLSPTELKGKYYTLTLSQPDGALTYYCSATGNIDSDAWLDVLVSERDRRD